MTDQHQLNRDIEQHRLDRDIKQIISENGLKAVIGALAKYCHSPNFQHYNVNIMQVCFRRLNKIHEYLNEKSQ